MPTHWTRKWRVSARQADRRLRRTHRGRGIRGSAGWPRAFLFVQAVAACRRCWKHSRQNTGRPWVGRKGTVVSLPHCEQLVLVSARIGEPLPPPVASARLALQALQRLGSFLKPLSAKNICSPPVKTNSAPHSEHFRTLSWYSTEAFPLRPQLERERAELCTKG